MDASIFASTVASSFQSWLKYVNKLLRQKKLVCSSAYSWPTSLRIAESPSHFLAELVGVSAKPPSDANPLRTSPVAENVASTASFFVPGDVPPDGSSSPSLTIGENSSNISLAVLSLCTPYDEKIFLDKIGFSIQQTIIRSEDAELPLYIHPSAKSLLLHRVDLIRSDSFRIFFRSVATAIAFRKDLDETELAHWLASIASRPITAPIPYIIGFNAGIPPSAASFARELMSLTNQDVTEGIIDSFIRSHSGHFAEALGRRKVLAQCKLKWIERGDDDPEASIPDYLLERKDGYFDILDLKTAAWKYRSLTRGGRARCRFNAYVSDLIAQLKGYERYFKRGKNREWALENCGIRVKQPKLIGIVGNHENFERDDVDLALEQYKDNIAILSYPDLVSLLLKADASVDTKLHRR